MGDDGDIAQLFDRVCGGHAGTGGVGKRGRIIHRAGMAEMHLGVTQSSLKIASLNDDNKNKG